MISTVYRVKIDGDAEQGQMAWWKDVLGLDLEAITVKRSRVKERRGRTVSLLCSTEGNLSTWQQMVIRKHHAQFNVVFSRQYDEARTLLSKSQPKAIRDRGGDCTAFEDMKGRPAFLFRDIEALEEVESTTVREGR